MAKLRVPNVPAATMAIEIDKAINEIGIVLDLNLSWLENSYGRAFRFLDIKGKRLYFPEVFIGSEKKYHRVTPDSKLKSTCFFVVGKEENEFEANQKNYLKYRVGIVFWANLKVIDSALNQTEDFTQNLIRDARRVLTEKVGGKDFSFKIINAERDHREIYREFNLEEDLDEYFRKPMTGFRINLDLTLREDCGEVMYDRSQALLNNIGQHEVRSVILPSVDFSQDIYFNALSEQQKTDLLTKLQA